MPRPAGKPVDLSESRLELSWFRRLLKSRYRLSGKFYIGIGMAVSLTVAASLVGWFFFDRVSVTQSRVSDESVPEMVAAFGVAQYSSNLITAAPRLTTAATIGDFSNISSLIQDTYRQMDRDLAALALRRMDDGTADPLVERVRTHADSLVANIRAISDEEFELFGLANRSETMRSELTDLRVSLEEALAPAIDDQLFYTVTGYRDRGKPPVPSSEHLSEGEISRYRHLAEMLANGNAAIQTLSSVFSIEDSAASVEPLRERFESAVGRIQGSLSAIEESAVKEEVVVIFDRLFDLGAGNRNGFDLKAQELTIRDQQQGLLVQNGDIARDLVAEVDVLVNQANENVQEANRASARAIFTGRTLLLSISAVSVVAAVLIAWLFVGRVLLRRIQTLSGWMRQMSGGDLEAQVAIEGRDEVADMAAALEVFRNYALEVQRLNLVEKMAEELQGKNDQLETALQDLNRAQDQIVVREKLAALGELTAGVAHEVRNPLNFVKNFAEVSEELLEELREVIEDNVEKLDEDQRSLIAEISGDLTGNLERIRSHGDRANRIVHDMLMMGRGSAEWQLTDINTLLDEYARLAYHSARATDPDFQLDWKAELDPDVGEMEVITQDLSRVFLNLVSNACYATDEKRRAAAELPPGGEPYVPTLWLSTKRGDESCEIRVKDNGSGMPPEVIEKIFNPFFTTKPTGQGTGLGLTMSNDIVREHGGTIRVESEPGEFTEMIIELPLQPPERKQGAEAEESDLEPGPEAPEAAVGAGAAGAPV